MEKRPIRIGSVGCGGALRFYAAVTAHLRKRGLAELVAACDTDEKKAAYVREEFGITRFTGDYRELVTSADVDLVLVLTPDVFHAPITRLALESGKHVLVEKPMSVIMDAEGRLMDIERSLAEGTELVRMAKAGPAYLACAPFVILSPTYQAMWRKLHGGELGKVLQARALYGSRGPRYHWVYQPGGGSLFNLAIYNLTSLTGFLGPARRVFGLTGVSMPEHEVWEGLMRCEAEEDTAQIMLDFGENVFAVIGTGWNMARQRTAAIELYGQRGTMHMLGYDWAPAGYEQWSPTEQAWKEYAETAPNWTWADGLSHFVECIWNGTPPHAMLDHAYHVLEIIYRAKAASRSGQIQELGSTFDPEQLLDWQKA